MIPLTPIAPETVDALAARWGEIVLTLSWKGLVLLALASLLHVGLRRGPAAARHLVWTGSLVGLLALPLLGVALPTWEIAGWRLPQPEVLTQEPAPVQTASYTELYRVPQLARLALPDDTAQHFTVVPLESDATSPLSRPSDRERGYGAWTWALLVWELGVLLVALWLASGWVHLRRLQRSSRPIDDSHWLRLADGVATELGMRRPPRLMRTATAMTPLTWGVLRPVVLLPASADQWPTAQRIDVLRHEFAHVQRRDVLTQVLAQICCALLWMYPLPWIAAARMRLERERACDDRVLLAGSRASSYAGHLLEMARSLRSEHGLAAATIGMARRSQLGERMDSLLDDAPRGRRFGRIARSGLVLALIALLLPLAAMRPSATQAEVSDPDTPRVEKVKAPRAVPTPPRTPAVAVIAPRGEGFHFENGLAWAHAFDEHAESHEIDARHSNFQWNEDDHSLEVEMDGRIRFAEDDSGIEWMEKGAYFELETREGRERRRMEVEAPQDGEIERTYYVRGERTPIDDDALAWFSEAIGQYLLRSGVGTVPRVRRWVEEGGVDGAMERIEALGDTHAASNHWSALIGLEELDEDDRARAMEEFHARVDSDFEKVRILHALPHRMLDGERGRAAYLSALRSIDSDFEKGRALALLLDAERAKGAHAPFVIGMVDEIDSDFEKARALVQALPLALDDDAARRKMWESIGAMDSDFEKARVIHALLEKLEDDETMMLEALEATSTLESDFEKGRLLREMADAAARYPSTREKYMEIAEQMDSDHEYGQVVRALRRAGR